MIRSPTLPRMRARLLPPALSSTRAIANDRRVDRRMSTGSSRSGICVVERSVRLPREHAERGPSAPLRGATCRAPPSTKGAAMTTAAGTLLFLLIIVAIVAVAAIAVVVVLLGVLAGLSTALAAFIE